MKIKKQKKLISVLLAALLLLCSLPFAAFAEDSIAWSYDENTATLTVSGEGAIPDYELDEKTVLVSAPWANKLHEAKKIVLSEGITYVGASAFMFNRAEEIILPSTLKTVGVNSFAYSVGVKELNLPEGLESLDESSFCFCVRVEKLYIPSTIKDLEGNNFTSYISSPRLKSLVNMSDSEVVSVVSFGAPYFEDEGIEEFYTEYLAASFEMVLKYGADFDDNDLFNASFIDYVNENFDKSFTVDNIDELEIWIDRLIDENYSYFPTERTATTCKEVSAQHEYCRKKGLKHVIYETGEECECFSFSGAYGENASWSIDRESRTLIISGTGEMKLVPYSDYPPYALLNRYFDTVTLAGSSITKLYSACDTLGGLHIESLILPATLTEFSGNGTGYETHIKAVEVEEGSEKFFSRGGALFENTDDGIALVYCPNRIGTEYTVPSDVSIIKSYAFTNSTLDKIVIPENVKRFESAPFFECYSNVYVYNKDAEIPDVQPPYGSDSDLLFSFYGTLYCYPDSTFAMDSQRENDYNRCKIVIFEDKEVERIEIETLPDKCDFVRTYEYLWSKGMTVRVYFKDGTSVVRKSGFRTDIPKLDERAVGIHPVTVSYRTFENNLFETSYDLEIKDVEYIDIRSGESKTKTLDADESSWGIFYYRFVPAQSGDYIFSWDSKANSKASVWIADEMLDDIENMAGYDNSCTSKTMTLEKGEAYYIRVQSVYSWQKDDAFTLSISCAGHVKSDWIIDAPATCLEKGAKHTECLNCGEIFETAEIPAMGHTPSAVSGKGATCEEPGLTEGSVCSTCGVVLAEQEVIPATGHNDSNDDGKCDSCGKQLREQTFVEKIKEFFKKIIDFFKRLFP